MARIKHPNPQQGTFTDRIGGVVFRDGFAEVDLTDDENLREAYLMHGYEISVFTGITVDFDTLTASSGSPQPLAPLPAPDYLADWSKAKLTAYATDQSIDIGGAKTKAEILAAITAQSPLAYVDEA